VADDLRRGMRAWSVGGHRVSRIGFLAVTTLLAGCVGESGGAEPIAAEPLPRLEPIATLPTVGLDPEYLASAYEAAAELPRLRCLVIARHGEMQAEECFRGPGLDGYANVKSVSKSIISALVGIAIEEGHLDGAEQTIFPFFSAYLGGDTTSAKRQITIGNLLSMQSGLERTSGDNYGRWVMSPNWISYAVTRPVVATPGSTRLYSTGNSHLLSAILTEATGMSTWEYAREKLAEPLGIRLPSWPTDPQGIYFGGNEMRLTPRDMIRFGELYRNGGRVGDRQVVSERWIEESLAPRTRSRSGDEQYGYSWFLADVNGRRMYYAWGYGGQYIFVVPDLQLTVATTSDPDDPRSRGHNQAVLSILRNQIIPAAEKGAHRAAPGVTQTD
jgi:CubicO group peptidase (beta-lactamase class C family)